MSVAATARGATESVLDASSVAAVQRRPEPSLESAPPSAAFPGMVAGSLRVQASALRLSQPSDPAEREAESVADRVTGGGSGASTPVTVSCAPAAGGAPARDRDTADLNDQMGGGSPLPPAVAKSMGEKFDADFSGVKVHTDERAASLANRFAARAFTVGGHVFFSRGAFQPGSADGRKLIAHELAHTIQQGAARQRGGGGAGRSAIARAATAAVQRLGVSDALDYFADKANLIPGFRMLTVVIGVNPINMSRVERTAANVLRAIVEFVPGGGLITQALDNHGIFERAGTWASQQLRTLGDIGSSIRQALNRFIDGLSWRDIFDLGGVWDRAKRIFTDPVGRIRDFVVGLATGFVTLIKDAILRPIAALARGTEGWNLLCAVLGRDPITGDPAPRDPATLIGGFLRLIGQQEIWENMQRANAIPRAMAWFRGAMQGLVAFVTQIPGLFVAAFRSLELMDIVLLPRAFLKVGRVFGSFLGRFVSWGGQAMWNLLEIVFDVVSPGAWGYVRRTGAALRSILRNPIPFMRNLVAAGMAGFRNFGRNFLTHLRTGLIEWLTGSLPGVHIPTAFTLREIVAFVLSVLGIGWSNIRAKFVRHIGEPAMRILETTFDVVVTLVRDGPAAAWERIREHLANLQEMAIGAITQMVTNLIVQRAIPRIVAMFVPGAGFISAILSIYETVMVFVQRISRIVQVVTAFVNSIVQIAAGNISAAAARVESILAGLLSLAINFLMSFAGLGRVAERVMAVVERIRARIDAVLDRVVDSIVRVARSFLSRAAAAVGGWWRRRKTLRGGDNQTHTLFFAGEGRSAVLKVRSVETPYSDFLARANVAGDAAKLAAKNSAVPIAARIDTVRGQAPSTDPQEEGRRSTEVNTLLENLAPFTAILFGPTIPRSAAAPTLAGPNGGGFGTSMAIKPLTNKERPNGSAPTGSNSGTVFGDLNERRDSPGGASYYIKGHLLNQQLGGLGAWNNMTPLSRSGNAQHERRAESLVKRTVDLPAIVEYEVRPVYGGQPNESGLLQDISRSGESTVVKDAKQRIVRAERWVPTALTVRAWILDETLARRESILSASIPNAIERTFRAYHLLSSPRPVPVNLSRDGVDKISTLEGIGTTLAQRIVDRKAALGISRWSSYAQIAEEVPGIGAGRLQTLEGGGHVRLF